MKKLWSFLNQRLVVAFLSILIVSATFGVRCARVASLVGSLFDENEHRRDEVEALGRLQLVSFAEIATPTNAPQRYVGAVRNNSPFILSGVQAAICSYDAEGRLIDVLSRVPEGVGTLAPGQERSFHVDRLYDWDERRDDWTRVEAARTTLAFVAVETSKPETTVR